MQASKLWARVPLWWLAAIDDHLTEVEVKRDSVSVLTVLRVAITLSSHVGDNPEVWPSQKTIAAEAGVKVRTARRALSALESVGILIKRRRQRESTRYRIIFDRPNSDQSSEFPERPHGGPSKAPFDRPKCNLDRPLSDNLDRPLYGRLTEQTEQNTFNKKGSVRAVMGKNAIEPSDALVEAIRPLTLDGSYPTADREARQALQTVGREMEAKLIVALRHPITLAKKRPIGFAIRAVQRHGCVLPTAPQTRDTSRYGA